MSFVTRFLVSSAVAIVAALVAAIASAIVDIYMVGHGFASINHQVIDWPSVGVELGPADIVLLLVTACAWIITWRRLRSVR